MLHLIEEDVEALAHAVGGASRRAGGVLAALVDSSDDEDSRGGLVACSIARYLYTQIDKAINHRQARSGITPRI